MGVLFGGEGKRLSYNISPESTAIESARYDGDMHIKFKNGNGKEYTYPDVPEDVAKRFEKADSYGKAFNQEIKPK